MRAVSETEATRWRTALERIAGNNSGHWGWIAHDALTNRQSPASEHVTPAEWITRLTASLGELAQEHNQGTQAGLSAALDAHIRLALRWREERDAA